MKPKPSRSALSATARYPWRVAHSPRVDVATPKSMGLPFVIACLTGQAFPALEIGDAPLCRYKVTLPPCQPPARGSVSCRRRGRGHGAQVRGNGRSRGWGKSAPPCRGPPVGRSDVKVGDRQGVALDELTARLDDIAHQPREDLVGLAEIADLHLQQRARLLVERRLPELLGIHFAQTFVALHADALAARIINGIEKAARPEHGRLGVFASEPGRGGVDFLQVR